MNVTDWGPAFLSLRSYQPSRLDYSWTLQNFVHRLHLSEECTSVELLQSPERIIVGHVVL